MSSIQETVDEYCGMLRRRQIEGSMPTCKRTAEIMRLMVTNQKHADAAALIDECRAIGHKIQSAKPSELAIGNIVRRVLHIIREEAQHDLTEQEEEASEFDSMKAPGMLASSFVKTPGAAGSRGTSFAQHRAVSLSNLLDVGIDDLEEPTSPNEKNEVPETSFERSDSQNSSMRRKVKAAPQWKRKQQIIEAINELLEELDNIQQSITIQGVEHIHAKEVILTVGMSDTTFYFLKEASKKREFQVIVAEGCPRYDGHVMAKRLSESGIQTTMIADSAVFAMMARANKVLVGAHAVLANGGVICPVGINMVALAARKHSVPFVVLVGLHKLTPLFPHDPDLVVHNDFKSPADVVDYDVLAEAFTHPDAGLGGAGPGTTWRKPSSASASALSIVSAASSSPRSLQQAVASQAVSSVLDTHQTSSSGPLVHVPNPAFDYVPPHLISLFVTDMGGYTPSYVYRLLSEFYDRNDYLLSKQLDS